MFAATPLVVIVVLHWNGLDDTLRCLDSLARQTYRRLRVLVVDNGSTVDARPAIVARFAAASVVRLAQNRGWAGGNNAGLAVALAAGAKYVLLLNNDTVAEPELVERLVETACQSGGLGVLGPAVRLGGAQRPVFSGGSSFDPSGRAGFFADVEPSASPGAVRSVDVVNGCCMLLSRAAVERVGRFDERFFLVHEEADFCLRAAERGVGRAVLAAPLVTHVQHASFRRAGLALQAYYDTRNLLLLVRKHVRGAARARGLWGCLSHARYRYEEFHQAGEPERARAVAAGLVDGLTGRFGRWSGRAGPASVVAERALAAAAGLAAARRALLVGGEA